MKDISKKQTFKFSHIRRAMPKATRIIDPNRRAYNRKQKHKDDFQIEQE